MRLLLDTQVAMLANLGANYLVRGREDGKVPGRAGNARKKLASFARPWETCLPNVKNRSLLMGSPRLVMHMLNSMVLYLLARPRRTTSYVSLPRYPMTFSIKTHLNFLRYNARLSCKAH